jgi:hypothetical protein
MLLSEAIGRNSAIDPLDAALAALNLKTPVMSLDGACRYRIHELHKAFGHLGASVRSWPKLAWELARMKAIPPKTAGVPSTSLWSAVCNLHKAGQDNVAISNLLRRFGL